MKLTLQQLEAHLWGAANILRGKTAGQDYKNYILSLMFYKRLAWGARTAYHSNPHASAKNRMNGVATLQVFVKRSRNPGATRSWSFNFVTAMKSLRRRSSINGWSGS